MHPTTLYRAPTTSTRFSPLLDGDGVASMTTSRRREYIPLVSVPFSMGTVLHQGFAQGFAQGFVQFQSPSRWGRCCIPSGLAAHGGQVVVSVPFSMGTVLHRELGDPIHDKLQVSVPFSMGTVLHLRAQAVPLPGHFGFSPLLDGDGVASVKTSRQQAFTRCFSPLLDGDGVASFEVLPNVAPLTYVSVPFSMGTVLHPPAEARLVQAFLWFQSPSRWGRCCILRSWPHRRRRPAVSVPFSMGTVLHRWRASWRWRIGVRFQSPSRWGRCCISARVNGAARRALSFSPLLDGDGVASTISLWKTRASGLSFSPLLDGDGVASLPDDCHGV